MTDNVVGTIPMDRKELQNCCSCGKGMMHNQDIHFYEITASACVVDLVSIRQQHGLEVMMGAAAPLAQIFAPSTVVAHKMPARRKLVCAPCMMEKFTNILVMMEDE